MRFCMNTVVTICGLSQIAMTSTRKLHLDKKVIGLSILEKACWLEMKRNPDHKHLYHNNREIFKHQVAP